MKCLLCLTLCLYLFLLASCSTIERIVTPDNIGRALIIYGEAKDIYDDVIVTPEK